MRFSSDSHGQTGIRTFLRSEGLTTMPHEHEDVPYQAVFAATPAPLLVLTPDLVTREANAAYADAVRRSRDELLGCHIVDVFAHTADAGGDAVENLRASLERARDTGRPDTLAVQRYDIPNADGELEPRYLSPIQVPVLDESGQTALLLHRAEDVTEFVRQRHREGALHVDEPSLRGRMQQAEADLFARARELEALNVELRQTHEELALRALRDPLTGLLIRPVLLEQVTLALSRARRHPRPIAVLFVDLDRLKQVNDLYGHAAGDQLLRCFAERLRTTVRPGDSVARFGGDEFVVLLEGLEDPTHADVVAERVLQAARDCPAPPGVSTHPSVSVGVAVAHEGDVGAEALISRADSAMYRAKQAGGGRYQVFEAAGQV